MTERIITSISRQVRNLSRLNIYINNRFEFALPEKIVEFYKISVGKELSEEEFLDLKKLAKDIGSIYSKIERLIMIRPRSTKEIMLYLRKYNIDSGTSSLVIDLLQETKILDDYLFSIWWIDNRVANKRMSLRLLEFELISKGIPKDIYYPILSNIDNEFEGQSLKGIMEKELRMGVKDKNKLVRKMMGKGFRFSDINHALEDLEE